MKGNLIIISSPSGGGKGTLIKEILGTLPDIGYSISYTTRAGREGEENGRDYFFVSQAEFDQRIADGDFLEYAQVHGNWYGTSKALLEELISEGKDVILEIDVQGAGWVRKRMPDAVSIFIFPPTFEVLRDRLTARATEGTDALALRLRNSFDEVKEYTRFTYVVVNDDKDSAARRLESIILAERQRSDRQMPVIKAILDSFDASKL
jgi:guanylate kinase